MTGKQAWQAVNVRTGPMWKRTQRKEIKMEQKIYVRMTKEALFDFLLYHTYARFAGFLTNVLGVAVILMGVILLGMGKIQGSRMLLFLAAGVIFVVYTPLQLKRRAKKQMEQESALKNVWEYTFSESGIRVETGEKSEERPWSQIEKVVTAPKTIGIYYGKDQAWILPKEALGEAFVPVMQMIMAQIGREKVQLR